MSIIGNLIIRAGIDLTEFQKNLKTLQKYLKNAGKEITAAGETLTKGLTLPIVAAGAASFKLAADMQDAMGATEQIFGKSAGDVQSWAKSLESYYGIASSEALEYANMMGSLLQNIGGLSEEEAAKQAQSLIKLAGDLTAMYGGTTADAVRALTGALKGNNTMLDNYGMAVNDAMIKTKAYEMGLYSGKGEMKLAAKQAATLSLIMEQSGAAQGQAAREADGASGSMRALVTEAKNLAASIGDILLPVVTPMLGKIKEWIQKFSEMDTGTKELIVKIALMAAAIGPVMLVVGNLTTGIGGLIGNFNKAIGIIKGGGGIISALGALIGPAGIALVAITAIATAAYLIIKNWEPIKKFFADLWEGIKLVFANIGGWFGDKFNQAKNAIVLAFSNIGQWFGEKFSTAWQAIKNAFSNVGAFFSGIWSTIKSTFVNVGTTIATAVSGAFKTAVNGVLTLIQNTINGFIKNINGVVGIINAIPGVNLGKIKQINIPKLADGGIVTSPTLALIGEAGPEAVVPLDSNMSGRSIVLNISGNHIMNERDIDILGERLIRKLRTMGV